MSTPAGTPSGAVFLSYASEDTEAAQRIASALRDAGIEVWFDKSELRGGDSWDRKIRHQIRDCALFLPVISARTQTRSEGYFRLEWRLAEQRTHLMGRQRSFLVPVCVDDTSEKDADVPDAFLAVQWTRLPRGETPGAFLGHIQRLLSRESAVASPEPPVPGVAPPASPSASSTAAEVAAVSGDERRTRAPSSPASLRAWAPRPGALWGVGLPLLLIAVVATVLVSWWHRREHAREVLLPGIEEALATAHHSNARILGMALEVEKALPHDHALAQLWPQIAATLTVETQPLNAEVYWKDYADLEAPWNLAGSTPLIDARVPRDVLRVEVRKSGYQTVQIVTPRSLGSRDKLRLPLDRAGELPRNMVRIPTAATEMNIIGLDRYGGVEVPEFLADRYEVTNRDYQAFVDAGGYAKAAYWRFPVIELGREIPLAAALARFVDHTGRPGPATWEAGTYPDGLADHPVAGVSWYEAAAYAAWAGKQLPTAYHFAQMADTWRAEYILPLSNFSSKATTTAGQLAGLSSFGVYDIAGNVREWVVNASANPGERFILGGGYNDPTYAFNDAYAQPALDRSPENGFRCIRALPGVPVPAALGQPLAMATRDYAREQPVDDRTFAQFARQYVYDRAPLDARIDKVLTSDDWKLESVSVNAAYNGERLPIYVFLPVHAAAPYQPVVLFPGSGVLFESRFDPSEINDYRDFTFIVKSGRALVLPVYRSTFDRHDGFHSDVPSESVAYKDHVLMWVKDFSRTIDYLETRKDMRADQVAFLGTSWGGFMGGIIPAVEKRIRVVVLNVGGMSMEPAMPEVDQINYLPRITQPVLMLNGQYDNYFPVETAQKPLYRLLGTPAADKKMIVYPLGHLVPRFEFMKETLAWLDKYQPVRQPSAQ